jgi:hypothetical protein
MSALSPKRSRRPEQALSPALGKCDSDAGGVKHSRLIVTNASQPPAEITFCIGNTAKEAVLDKTQEHLTVNGC